MKASSGTTCCGSVVDLSKLHPLDDERSQPTLSSQEWGPISTGQWRRSGYIDPVKVGTLLSSDLKLGKRPEKANMVSRVVLLGVLFGVLIPVDMVPVKNSTDVHEGKLRLKRKYSDELMDRDEMTAMDQILEVNSRLRAPRGLSFREGDIAYSYVRSAINCPGNACLWPKSIDGFVYVPYLLSPVYDDMDRITIETGMQEISSGTCIKFIPRTHEASFLDIQPRYGCWSFLGQTGGSQTLSLQTPGCMWSGIAAHEFMHALGFVHEQSRSDRDHYVTIVWKNILPEQIHNFRKQATNNLNSPYDYSSVMHYGRYAFSEDGGPTIIPKPDPYIPIGQRDGPSPLDLHKINVLYSCGVN
ncbi:high choriolytic enzyme 1 isoform X2 [Poecilia latipinna]|uniref:high choriolytic enzyme 1 isoform X2 n=1 Tax=Poecilia formosa TaxID=48698 RepID=UPI00072E4BBB|nr:PREDICTED: high choriolytic enzyme 1-like isoform X2 [Poecilia formosa]XP_014896657.1 PREDICTED: high choriolytic enzyme 1-like isoform X2 [Poecilia latipinna]